MEYAPQSFWGLGSVSPRTDDEQVHSFVVNRRRGLWHGAVSALVKLYMSNVISYQKKRRVLWYDRNIRRPIDASQSESVFGRVTPNACLLIYLKQLELELPCSLLLLLSSCVKH